VPGADPSTAIVAGKGSDLRAKEGSGGAGGRNTNDGRNRSALAPGMVVRIELKKDQGTGELTEGKVREILTGSSYHPHGIKVRLEDGKIGRVRRIV
jgi:uncharacterized repeat protein (TIGR03833 family)